MKFIVCGSGDAIGIPGIFCKCRVCENARRNGGFDIRTRTGYLLDGTVKFDFGPDTLAQAQKPGLDLSDLEALFITHSHSDHFYPEDLWTLSSDVAETGGTLRIYGNTEVMRRIREFPGLDLAKCGIELVALTNGKTVELPNARVTAIATNHVPTEECLMFLIETLSANIMIANDSDRFPETAYFLLRGKCIDHLFIDCTWGLEHHENRGHMGLPAVLDVVERLTGQKTLVESSRIWPVHFSHNGSGTHAELTRQMARYHNIVPSYDGLTIKT